MSNATVYIALGSNLGEREQNCQSALDALAAHPQVELIAQSEWHYYPALTLDPSETQPEFCNGAAKITTKLTPQKLLELCQNIEQQLGRIRDKKWEPRCIDLDIISYGSQIVDLPGLQIPHPELHKRMFVLEPLASIAPSWCDPRSGESITALKEKLCNFSSTAPTSAKFAKPNL